MFIFLFHVHDHVFFLTPLKSTSFTEFFKSMGVDNHGKEVVQKAAMFDSDYSYVLENQKQ